MAGNGHAGRRREDADDRNLFHQQHPSTPPARFSSPSRPRRRDAAEKSFKSLVFGATASTLLQGLAWIVISGVAVAAHYGKLPEPDVAVEDRWNSWQYIISKLYFTENSAMPDLPPEALTSSDQMLHLSEATFAGNALLALASFALMTGLKCSREPRGALAWVVIWAVSVIAVTTVDVVVAAAMVRDLLLLDNWEQKLQWPGDFDALCLCPGAVLVVALRGGVLLLANVACMLLVLRRLHGLRKQGAAAAAPPQPATKADGPLDGYLYKNGDAGGVHNPAFVSDDTEQPWRTFRPEQEQAEDRERDGGHRLNDHVGHRLNDHVGHDLGYSSRQEDPDDIASHLTWMEEVDKHVDVHVRRGHVEDRPPQHHRHGFVEDRRFVEDRPPQYHSYQRHDPVDDWPQPPPQRRRGYVDDRYVDQQFPSGRLRAAYGPPVPGPMPDGYPAARPQRLPRLPMQPPALPPADYSPPARRRANGGAADRALAAGRAALRPVRQDRY